jgi:hypothetical protein
MIPLAQWAMKNYTPEVRNVGLSWDQEIDAFGKHGGK